MATRTKSTRTTKQKPSKELLEKLNQLSSAIGDMNSIFFGLKGERDDDRSAEILLIRAAAEHGYRKSSEALELADEIEDALKGEEVPHVA